MGYYPCLQIHWEDAKSQALFGGVQCQDNRLYAHTGDQVASRGPRQPQPFCGSAMLYYKQ